MRRFPFFMRKQLFIYLILIATAGFLLVGCSKSNDQREFENQALQQPQGFTETGPNGDIINTDPDDWRVGPMYRGLVSIGTPDNQPPYPNPLAFNQDLTINIYIRSIETLSRLEIYSFRQPSQTNAAIAVRDNLSSPTLETFTLGGALISGSTGGSQAEGLYRILIYDGQQNLITYGDIKIGQQ